MNPNDLKNLHKPSALQIDTDASTKLRRLIKSSTMYHEPQARAFAEQAQAFAEQAQAVVERFAVTLVKAAPHLDKIVKAFEELSEQTKRELTVLAKYGWYVDLDMSSSPGEYSRLFDDGDAELAHLKLESYYEEHAAKILKRLSKNFPDRACILSEAFKAHEEKRYALSVPVFLAQADGICAELTGVELYTTERDKETRDHVMKLQALFDKGQLEPYLIPLLAPLLDKKVPIRAGRGKRNDYDLNRHAVLHGESTTYDTIRNSCKAMSLLSYAEWILEDS